MPLVAYSTGLSIETNAYGSPAGLARQNGYANNGINDDSEFSPTPHGGGASRGRGGGLRGDAKFAALGP